MTDLWTAEDQVEEWRPIPGFSGYEASNLGGVRSFVARGPRPYQLVLQDEAGYKRVHVTNDSGRQRNVMVHSLVALAFLGLRPDRLQVRHLDGVRGNNRASNLAYGTKSENEQDKVRHGNHELASRTACLHGHEYTPENTLVTKTRGRCCRTCRNIWKRASYRRQTDRLKAEAS